MDNYRLFIDVPVEPGLAKQLMKQFAKLNLPWLKLKKTGAKEMHVTLKFLGDTPLDKLAPIISTLGEIKIKAEDINLGIDIPKIFNPENPRVLVVALKPNSALQELYDKIEDALWQNNLANKEIRRFNPHLTMARVKQATSIDELSDFTNWRPTQSNFDINYFELQQSELTKLGPIYTVMQTFDL